MKSLYTIFICFISLLSFSQTSSVKPVKVLFIGNSYTYYHNMPQICIGMAASTGDVLITDQSTVGGYRLSQHCADSTTLAKIKKGSTDYNNNKASTSWDYVVVQEHSQLPSNPADEIEKNVLPYAHFLDSLIHLYNVTAHTVFYQTWGRKNGDSSRCAKWTPVCTYSGMDSLLQLNYAMLAKKNNALLSPVGSVWKYIREQYPAIELYYKDESHPSAAGSYAAACCFYTLFIKKDPMLITYNYTLTTKEAATIRKVVKKIVYDQSSK